MRYILAFLIIILACFLYVATNEARIAIAGEQSLRAVILDFLPNLLACFLVPLAAMAAFGTKNAAWHALGFTIGFILYDILRFLAYGVRISSSAPVSSLLGLLLFLVVLYFQKAGSKVRARNRS